MPLATEGPSAQQPAGGMFRRVRPRFWIQAGLGTVTGFLFVLTLVWRDWIEAVFRVDPDGGNGSLEWIIVGVLGVATASLLLLARIEWRRAGTSLLRADA
jgi:hypothetical protein